MRVATFPDWRKDNPYQRLLAEALAEFGVEVWFPQGYRRVLPFCRQVLPGARPNILHLHWPSPYLRSQQPALRGVYCLRTLADLALVRRAGIPIVWTVHNLVTHDTPTPRIERWFSTRLAALADRLIVHSEAARREVVDTLAASPEKVHVIPHGPFRDAYGLPPSRQHARKALALPADKPLVLFFGMIRRYKGLKTLLAAWETLGERRGDAMLLIAGQATDEAHAAELRNMAAALPGVRLDFRHVPDTEVPALLAAADIMVLPFEQSLTSGTVRLAQDYGVPVIVSRNSSACEAPSAMLVDARDPEALGAAILTALRSRPSVAGHVHANDPTWKVIAEEHTRVLFRLGA